MSNYGGGYNRGYTDHNDSHSVGGQGYGYGQQQQYNQGGYGQQNNYNAPQNPNTAPFYGGQQIEMQHVGDGEAPQEVLNDLNHQINEAGRMMDQILADRRALIKITDTFEREQASRKVDAEVTHLTAYNKDLVTHIRKLKGKYPNQREIKNEGDRFKRLTDQYARNEHAVAGQLKDQIRRQVEVAYGDSLTDQEKNDMVENGSAVAFQRAVMSSRKGAAQNALNNARERQEEIERIAQQMNVLLELFQNMNEMIVEQEVKVERIQEGAQETHEHIEEGVKQLEVAKEKAKSARRKKWWCLLIVVILIIIIIVVIMVTVVKPIIQGTNNKRSLEYLAHARRSILEQPVRRSIPPQARRALLE